MIQMESVRSEDYEGDGDTLPEMYNREEGEMKREPGAASLVGGAECEMEESVGEGEGETQATQVRMENFCFLGKKCW